MKTLEEAFALASVFAFIAFTTYACAGWLDTPY